MLYRQTPNLTKPGPVAIFFILILTPVHCVPSLLHVHVTAQTIHRKHHACSRMTEPWPAGEARRAKGEPTAKAIHWKRCRLQCVGFLQEMLKSLAEGGVRFLFPVIRQALWIRLRTKATLTAAQVSSPEGETHSDSEGCVKPGIPLALEK